MKSMKWGRFLIVLSLILICIIVETIITAAKVRLIAWLLEVI